jgi:hypothetical protein
VSCARRRGGAGSATSGGRREMRPGCEEARAARSAAGRRAAWPAARKRVARPAADRLELRGGGVRSELGDLRRRQRHERRGRQLILALFFFNPSVQERYDGWTPMNSTTFYPSNQTRHWLSPTTSNPTNQTENLAIPNHLVRDIPIP